MPGRLFHLSFLDESISVIRDVWLVSFITMFIYMPVLNANSVDPDQTPRSAASDLGLHYLPISHLWDARLKWVITITCFIARGEINSTSVFWTSPFLL